LLGKREFFLIGIWNLILYRVKSDDVSFESYNKKIEVNSANLSIKTIEKRLRNAVLIVVRVH